MTNIFTCHKCFSRHLVTEPGKYHRGYQVRCEHCGWFRNIHTDGKAHVDLLWTIKGHSGPPCMAPFWEDTYALFRLYYYKQGIDFTKGMETPGYYKMRKIPYSELKRVIQGLRKEAK